MPPTDVKLLASLSVGPSFLLLGQASASMADGFDPAWLAALDAAGLGPATRPRDLLALQRDTAGKLLSALGDRTRTTPPAPWLEEVARFPWNAVFTTRIDAALTSAFRTEWRTVVPTAQIRTARYKRSPTEMRLCFLFGSVSLEAEDHPPLDPLAFATRRRTARENLNELTSSLITPRGSLLIDGYSAGDMLTSEDLFAALSDLRPGQAHMFSASEDLLADPFLAGAVAQGILIPHQESLASYLSEAEASGRLRMPLRSRTEGSRFIMIGNDAVELNRDVWNSIIGSARPIDDTAWTPYPRVSSPLEYDRFHAFLGSTDTAPPWQPIASTYNFERDFEEALYGRVRHYVAERNVPSPLIVSGQTATGKSVGLMALALRVAREGEAAVLHVSKRGERPSIAALDSFALWAEERGAAATLVVWDGMNDVDEYYNAHKQLRARGRRVLIVGTTYLDPSRSLSGSIEAPAHFSAGELERLPLWLARFGVTARFPHDADASVLAALYRLLPASRRKLAQGLNLEIRSAERTIERRARRAVGTEERASAVGTMARALIEAGLVTDPMTPAADAFSELRNTSFLDRSSVEQLTALVLMPGRHGLPVPLDLVLRILGREGSLAVVEAVKDLDIIRWNGDEAGNQYLSARTRLEAELLAKQDLAGPVAELEIAATFVREVRQAAWGAGGPEVQFLVDLFGQVGPQSRDAERYMPHVAGVLDAFQELHASEQRVHHRLVLIEANLLRKYVQWAQRARSVPEAERLRLLERSQDILEEALEDLAEAGRARLNLLVELASCLGAKAYELSETRQDLSGLVERIVDVSLAARSIDPENYYPVDVVAWVCERMLEKQALSDAHRVGLLADSLASFETIEPRDLSPKQRAKYDSRLLRFGQLMGDPALSEEHLRALRSNTDPAAYYLLARNAAGPSGGSWTDSGAIEALHLLRQAPKAVRADWRCAGLLLDLFWWSKTHRRFMRGEREVVAFSLDDWRECLEVVGGISRASTYDAYRSDFLRGLALFHLGAYKASTEVFEELDRATVGLSRRIIATYVASDESGHAMRFDGQVRHVTPDSRRGRVWIDALGVELPFIPYRFSFETMRVGDPLTDFHVAFNMRGAYADPVRVSGNREASR